jgi:hypothetical protein
MARKPSNADLVDIEAELLHETPGAYRIYDGKTTCWLPKSQVERNDDGTFTMPRWLATEKGLV